MTPLAITPPVIEPVSLSEAKDFLRLLAEEDELLGTLITAARLMVEAASGRMLIDQLWRLVLDGWPGGGEIRLPLAPVGSIVAARVYDSNGSPQAVAAASLSLVAGSDPPLIAVGGPVPMPGRGRAAIEIDVVAGFGPTRDTVPAPLRQAVLRLACRWFEHRGDVVSRDAARLPADRRAGRALSPPEAVTAMANETSKRRPVGAMRRRLLLEEPAETPDGVGGAIRGHALVAAVWAQVEWLSGEERWRAGRPEQAVSHRISLRWRAGVTAGQRLRDGEQVFDIRAVADPDGGRRRLVCLVEEVRQ